MEQYNQKGSSNLVFIAKYIVVTATINMRLYVYNNTIMDLVRMIRSGYGLPRVKFKMNCVVLLQRLELQSRLYYANIVISSNLLNLLFVLTIWGFYNVILPH